MRLVALSDTHGYHKKLTVPDGDILIYAGDFSMRARLSDVVLFANWLNSLPHEHKIIIPGNHDVYCEGDTDWARKEFSPAHYLLHSSVEVAGLRFFGSPYSSAIFEPSKWAFDYPPNGSQSKRLWSQIPTGTDILVTHGPPKNILDRVLYADPGEDPNVGDHFLMWNVARIQPRLHIFGHIHEGYGSCLPEVGTHFYNVCVCDVEYKPVNPITVIDL